MSKNGVVKPGDVRLESVVIEKSNGAILDITDHVVEISIYENLFKKFLSGSIVVEDTQNLQNVLPITGSESIKIVYYDSLLNGIDELKTDLTFHLSKVSAKSYTNTRQVVYVLEFVSRDCIANDCVKISKTFRGNANTIIDEIVHGKGTLNSPLPIANTQSTNPITFIANWWKPSQCIDYVLNRARSASNNSPSFVFFQTRNGYVFSSLSDMITLPIVEHFKANNLQGSGPTNGQQNQTTTPNIALSYQSILDISYHKNYDYFERTRNGFYGGVVVGHDPITQRYSINAVERDWNADNHLNQYSCIDVTVPSYGMNNLHYIANSSTRFDNEQGNDHYSDELKVLVDRQTIFSRYTATELSIIVYGRNDYEPGRIVKVSIPKPQQITKDDDNVKDGIYSGNYIISAVKHTITNNTHKCTLHLMKDSYIFDINKGIVDKGQTINEQKKIVDDVGIQYNDFHDY